MHEFKEAVVRLLLKKSRFDASDQNYRSVLNLPCVTKLLEKVVQVFIQVFFGSNELMPRMQSAYWRFHSTEKAVKKVYNDLMAADGGNKMSAL